MTTPTTTSRTRTRTALLAVLALAAVLALVVPAGAAEIGLAALRNSVGISHHPLAASNFDGGGFSYSRVALLLEGVDGGSAVEADGLTYTWPATDPGEADNVEMAGQLIPVIPGDATRIGFLGASHNGPITADVTLHYTRVVDGEREDVRVAVPLTFSDWTLNANTRQPEPGNETVISTRFRVNGTTVEQVPTHVFATELPIDPSMTLQSIELPDEDRLHLFGLALG
jgi:hypothetical protein